MSDTIPKAHVEQFNRRVLHLAQQKGSKLRNTLMEEPVIGKQGNAERIGKVQMQQRTSRHADTPLVNTPHSRRVIPILDWEVADLVDTFDRLKVIISAESAYARAFAYAAGRKWDERILLALNGTAVDGDGNSVAFDAGNSPTTSFDASGGALSITDILDMRTALLDNGADETEGFHLAHDGEVLNQLIRETATPNVSSADYNSLRALQSGQINTFLGFTWHRVIPAILPAEADNDRYILAWSEFGGQIGLQQDIKTRMSERGDKSYSNQVYISTMFGVVRTDEARVARVRYDPAA